MINISPRNKVKQQFYAERRPTGVCPGSVAQVLDGPGHSITKEMVINKGSKLGMRPGTNDIVPIAMKCVAF